VRVLVVAEQLRRPVPGGIGTYLLGLLQGLKEIGGVDVTLFASRGPSLDHLGVPIVTTPVPGPLLTRGWDRGLLATPRGFDVVHAPSLAVPVTQPTPLSVMVHDLAWRDVPDAFPPRGRRWHEAALRRTLRRAKVIMVPSRPVAVALHDRRVHVVDEGSDHLAPPDHDGAAQLLARLGVVGPYLLTLSTLEPRKNLPRLLAAYRMARTRLPEPWPLVVVGPSGWGPSLQPQEGVVLAGFVDEGVKSALLAGARALAYVPLLEGFGLPAVEAMAMGAPVVASPMPSIGEAALVVDPADVSAMAAALVSVGSDDAVRSRLVDAGRLRAADLTWAGAARRHLELWESMT
jgi:glycosyltransferase involved in cell wall biosynthesis